MNGALRWIFAALVCVALFGAVLGGPPVVAQPADPLAGSFSAALVMRRVSPADPFRENAAALLLRPSDGRVVASDLTPGERSTHILGWTGPDRVLIVQRDATLSEYVPLAFDAQGAPGPALAAISADQALALAPDGRIVGWPRFVQDVAPFTALTVYDPAALAVVNTIAIPGGEGLLGAQLAGFQGNSAYFTLRVPSDGFVRVDLASGAVDGPLDLLAAGDGSEFLLRASLDPAGSLLAVAGRLQPKDADGLFDLAFMPPWPQTTDAQPRPVAAASPVDLAVGEVQGMTWSHDGAHLAIVAATPGDFSASSLALADAALTQATPLDVRAAHGSCVIFTPDDQWLLYVGEDGAALLALPVSDPAAGAQPLLQGAALFDLCEAEWQPVAAQPTSTPTPAPVQPTPAVVLPNADTLAVGQEVTGTLDDATFRHDYSLELEAGQTVTITMLQRSGDLDPFLIVLGPSGAELARNDDAVQTLEDYAFNAQIGDLIAPTNGTYTVRATRFGEETGPSSGEFALRVSSGAPATPAPALEGTPIAVGDEVTGSLSKSGGAVDYVLDLAVAQMVTITMERTSGDLDALLLVLDANGREVARNDDAVDTVGDTTFNAQIVGFSPPAAGTYLVRATRYDEADGTSTGDYRLSVVASTAELPGTEQLTVGGSMRGEITATAYVQEYNITLDAGQVITVTMERQGGDLDCYLSILGPDGAEVASNDDAPTQVGISALNSQIVDFRASSSGTYTLRATRYDEAEGTTTGPYVLRVSGAQGNGPAATAIPRPTAAPSTGSNVQSGAVLTVGDTVTGRIDGDVFAIDYPISLTAGETIGVTMVVTSGNLDTFAIVYDPSNDPVAFNDDAPTPLDGNSYNSQIVGYTALTSGVYSIRATRYDFEDGDTTGGFRLEVMTGTPVAAEDGGTIQFGQPVTGLLSTTTFAVDYTIALQAGDVVTITMERLDETLDPYLSLRNASGDELTYNDDADPQVGDAELNAAIRSFTIAATGTYTVRATRFFQEGGTSTGRFTLTVTRGG